MLNKAFENLKFMLENIHSSTNAVSVSLVDSSGSVLGECGELDTSIIAETVSLVSSRSRELYEFLNGVKDEDLCLYSEASKGSFVIYSMTKTIFLLVFFPRTTNIFAIKESLDKSANRMRGVFSELKIGAKPCRL